MTGTFFHHSSAINTGSAECCYVYIAIPEAKTGARNQSKLVDTTGARVSLATGTHSEYLFTSWSAIHLINGIKGC